MKVSSDMETQIATIVSAFFASSLVIMVRWLFARRQAPKLLALLAFKIDSEDRHFSGISKGRNKCPYYGALQLLWSLQDLGSNAYLYYTTLLVHGNKAKLK